jgi:hypothetical protein
VVVKMVQFRIEWLVEMKQVKQSKRGDKDTVGPHTRAWMLTSFILSTGVGAVDPTQAIFEVWVLWWV